MAPTSYVDELYDPEDEALAGIEGEGLEQQPEPPLLPSGLSDDTGARPAMAPGPIQQYAAAKATRPPIGGAAAANAAEVLKKLRQRTPEDDEEFRGLSAAADEVRNRKLAASIGAAADEFTSRLLNQQPSAYWQRATQQAEEPLQRFQATSALRKQQTAEKQKLVNSAVNEMNAQTALQNAASSAPGKKLYAQLLEELVKAAQAMPRPGRAPMAAAVLVTMKQTGTVIGAGIRTAIKAAGLLVLDTELGHRIAYQDAPAAGLGVAQYAPDSEAAAEVRALLSEVLAITEVQTRKKSA